MTTGFWHFDAGNVASWFLVLFAIIAFLTRFARRIDTMDDAILDHSKTLKSMTETLKALNESGTQFSQRIMAMEMKLGEERDRRLLKLETSNDLTRPQIAEMAANLTWISHYIQNGTAKPTTTPAV